MAAIAAGDASAIEVGDATTTSSPPGMRGNRHGNAHRSGPAPAPSRHLDRGLGTLGIVVVLGAIM